MEKAQESSELVTICWSYTPSDFFEARMEYRLTAIGHSYEAVIEAGKVEVRVSLVSYDREVFEKNEKLFLDDLTRSLARRMKGAEMRNFKPFTLSRPTITFPPDKPRNITLHVEVGDYVYITDQLDMVHTDAVGNVLSDSRQQRIDEVTLFSDLVDKYAGMNFSLDKMFESIQNASRNPDREFDYLYEVSDALRILFTTYNHQQKPNNPAVKEICKEIGICFTGTWKKLGDITNDPKYSQSRHGGKRLAPAERAGADVCNEARKHARDIVVAYVRYLETKGLI